MDNLLITIKRISCEEYIQKAQQVLQQLREYKLYLNPLKCMVVQPKMEFLEIQVSEKGVRMNTSKV